MIARFSRIEAVRRLLRLAGFAGFVFVALAVRADAAPTDGDQVIVPSASVPKPTAGAPAATGTSAFTIVAIVLLAGAGGWLLWRNKARTMPAFARGNKQLSIEETRSLGGRQYLVVASYRDQKFLLGVCPGRIDMLTTLPPSSGTQPPLSS